MKLWRVSLKVVPTKDHPMFFEVQFGMLHIWLFAENPEDASERVATIVEQLPYERFGKAGEWQDKGIWRAIVRPPYPDDPPEFAPHVKSAQETGFSICAVYGATGMDEMLFAELEPR